ncbi:MAG: nucleotidyl transferase AbiEii/AbiGii toxin family protein [FCB group bacterium]|nr:nucleotidyl transferase AbiEii/AbiGii toxin family protein [FCB group bacterium]
MLSLTEIKSFFPDTLQAYPRFMLREYVQVKILDLLFNQEDAGRLSFLGGTCLRLLHGNQRFSEDLDFDNRGMSKKQFNQLLVTLQRRLQQEGLAVEMRPVYRTAWHGYFRFPGLFARYGLSGDRDEKLFIRIDSEPQQIGYEPQRIILNRFEVFTTVLATPLPLLLSQKLFAILNRRRKKGRDFFDVAFLLGKGIRPDYAYLEKKIGILHATALQQAIISVCRTNDMRALARDVEPFLFQTGDVKKVLLFEDYFTQVMGDG